MLTSLLELGQSVPDVLGLVGVVVILWYYLLLQLGKCVSDSLCFSLANFIGSVLLLISLWFNWNLASVIIEIAWLGISLYGILKYVRRLKLQP